MRAYAVTALLRDVPPAQDGLELTVRLDDALSTKLVGVLRCRRHHFMARRNGSLHAVDMFLAHSNAEQAHADLLAARIVELQAEPGFSPAALLRRSHVPFFEPGGRMLDMAQEDLDAVRVTDGAFKELVKFVGSRDPATRRILLAILEADQARARDLTTLIASLGRQ
jgi:bacterioferritin